MSEACKMAHIFLAKSIAPALLHKPSDDISDHEVQPLKKKPPGIYLWTVPISIFTRISLHGSRLKIAH